MTRVSGVLGAVFVSLALAACTSDDAEIQTDQVFGPERPGRYSVGDSFTFDNPTLTWSVVAVEGEKVYWRSDRGDEQVTGHDPLLPATEWKNPDQGGGRRIISDVKGALFPLEVGNRMTFTSKVENWTMRDGVASEPQTLQTNWSCNVASRERVDVQAGSFDTFRVQCGRFKPSELVFYYAPRIGHYVVTRIDDASGQGTVTRNLISFRRIALGGQQLAPPPPPPPVVQTARVPPPPPPSPPPAKQLEPPPGVATGSGPRVVLGLFSSKENATRAWGIFTKENGDLLGDLEPQIVPAGRYFRVATERLASRASANDLCSKLKARGLECLISNK